MDKPIVVISGVTFEDLCLILDFAYLGQAQIKQDRLDDFLKAGELLQIRGLKDRRIQFMTKQVHTVQQTTLNRSFDATISSTQENSFTEQPSAKRPRGVEEDVSIQEATEIMKMLLESNSELDNEQARPSPVKETSSLPPQFQIHQVQMQTRQSQVPQSAQPLQQQTRKYIVPPPLIAQPLQTVKEKAKFVCRYCERSLSSSGRIKKHEIECNGNPDRMIAVCEVCQLEMKPSSLTHHKNSKHGQKAKTPSPMMFEGNETPTVQRHPFAFVGGNAISLPANTEISAIDLPANAQLSGIDTTLSSPEINAAQTSPCSSFGGSTSEKELEKELEDTDINMEAKNDDAQL